MASELAERLAYELEALMASETAMQKVAAECPTPEAHHIFLADFIDRILQKEGARSCNCASPHLPSQIRSSAEFGNL